MTANPIMDILLAVLGLFPAIALCIYVYIKDRHEKEPVWLLLLLLGLGALICIPAYYLETFAGGILNSAFSDAFYEVDGLLYMDTAPYYCYQIIDNFFGVALIEESLKWLVLFLVTRNSTHFNSLFDGLIYAVFVSLGFAAYENVQYVLTYGLSTALIRAVSAVPGHMFFAVFMGYYYTLWHLYRFIRKAEGSFVSGGIIPARSPSARFNRVSLGWLLALSLIVPVLVHGTYDFCLSIDSIVALILCCVMLVVLYVFCFLRIRKLSKHDNSQDMLTVALLVDAHPELRSVFGLL